MNERIRLTITEVNELQKVGQRQIPKLTFKAKNPEGKELSYFTFTQKFFPLIVKGAEIDAEIETLSREHDGNTYIDRKVMQLYVNNEPVASASKGQSGGWRGKSEAELEIERHKNRSIEAQTALKEAMHFAEVYNLSSKLPGGGGNPLSEDDVCRIAGKFLGFLKGEPATKPEASKPALKTDMGAKPPDTRAGWHTESAKAEPAKAKVEENGKPKPVDWGKVNRLAARMGIKNVVIMNKALGVAKPNDWTETEELALDKLEEYARLNSYTGAGWRELEKQGGSNA